MKKNLLTLIAIIFMLVPRANAQFSYDKAFSLGNNANDRGTSVASDASGNLYCAGNHTYWMDLNPLGTAFYVYNNGTYTTDIYVAKYDQQGIMQWGFDIGGSGDEYVTKIILDLAGNVFITGSFQDSVDFDPGSGDATRISKGGRDIFLAKYDSNGIFQWVIAIGDSLDERGNDIAVIATGGAGKIIMTGEYDSHSIDMDPDVSTHTLVNNGNPSLNTGNCFVAAYSTLTGSYEWSFNIGGFGGSSGNRVITDINDNYYVAGDLSGDSTDFDPGSGTFFINTGNSSMAFLAKYSGTSPVLNFAESFGGAYFETVYGLQSDDIGNIFLGGYFNSDSMDIDPGPGTYYLHNYPGGVQDIYVAKFDTAGSLAWAFAVGGYYSEVAQDLVIDNNNHLFITGNFGDTVDFDPGPNIFNLVGQLGSDAYLAEYNQQGQFIDAMPFHGNGGQFGLGLCTIPGHKVGVTGLFSSDTIDFDPGPAVHNLFVNGGISTWTDAFVAVYDYNADGIDEIKDNSSLSIYPVPAQQYITVAGKNASPIDEVSVTNVLGEKVFQSSEVKNGNSHTFNIDCSRFPGGMYFVQLKSGGEIHSGKFVKD